MTDRTEIEAQIEQMVDIMTNEYVLKTINEFATDPDIVSLSAEEKANLFHQRLSVQELESRGITLPESGLRISSRVFEDESPVPQFRYTATGDETWQELAQASGRRVEVSEDYVFGAAGDDFDPKVAAEELRQVIDASGMATRIESFLNIPVAGQPAPPQSPIAPFAACICGGLSPLCAGYGS